MINKNKWEYVKLRRNNNGRVIKQDIFIKKNNKLKLIKSEVHPWMIN